MVRICAKNKQDCCITCRDSGYAFYAEPYGPCYTGCHDEKLAEKLVELLSREPDRGIYGRMRNVKSHTLAFFAKQMIPRAPDETLNRLEYLLGFGNAKPQKFNIAFEAFSVADAIFQIADGTEKAAQ